jgi:ABC-2 type transport system ATP-binding protein
VLGHPVGDVEIRRRVGFLPAELHLDRRHTVAETIRYHRRLRGDGDGIAVDALLGRFDLDPTRTIGELSTGNRRKVGIVIAFAGRPELLILDEPTSGLDPLLQHELLALVEERVADGATVFLSSHVLPEVERVADRVAILRRGQLALVGSTADLRARARQQVELHTTERPDSAGFDAIPGVVAVEVHGNVLVLTVEGSVDAALRRAMEDLTIERVVTRSSDLEDVFLELYR